MKIEDLTFPVTVEALTAFQNDGRTLPEMKATSSVQPFLALESIPEILPEECTAREVPCLSDAAEEAVQIARAGGDRAVFRVVGDCMEREGIEDGGWVAVDFTRMPRAPKYGKGGCIDPCLCLARWEGRGRPLVMVKAYSGKWGPMHTVSTRYANEWAGGEYRMDVGLFAEKIYGVVFASWGRDGHLNWKRDKEDYPAKLPAAATIRGVNVGEPEVLSEVRI